MRIVLLLSVLCIHPAFAEDVVDPEKAKEGGRIFAECAGRYQALAAFLGKEAPAMSEVFMDTARGASLTSQYFYSVGYSNGKKALSVYQEMSDAITYGERVRALALVEGGGVEAINEDIGFCTSLSGVQKDIIQQIREQIYLGDVKD